MIETINKIKYGSIEVIKVVKDEYGISIYMHDNSKDINFWVDSCKNSDGSWEWDFNAYIFKLWDSHDLELREYQENAPMDDIDACVDDSWEMI